MARASIRPFAATVASLADAEIVARVLGGETELFELILRRHNGRLFRAARAILKDDAEAEDAVQQGYISAYQHLDQFKGDAQLSTWLTRIVVHAALGRLRAAQRRSRIQIVPLDSEQALPPEPDRPDPEDAVAAMQLRSVMERAVDGLPDLYRVVFMLREVQQLSTAETAHSLEISEELVKVRLHRAKRMLREALNTKLDAAIPEIFTFLGERCDRIVARVMDEIASLPQA